MTDNDRELLELAAKAAGMHHLIHNGGKTNAYYACSREYMTSAGSHTPWNPLTDDGDALRLAVKIGLPLPMVTAIKAGLADADPYAATRRAIVRAAAEIGKGMK